MDPLHAVLLLTRQTTDGRNVLKVGSPAKDSYARGNLLAHAWLEAFILVMLVN